MKSNDHCKVDPVRVTIARTGALSIHHIYAESESRMAFKIKCTNIDEYRVRPVYGFIEARGKVKLEVLRLDGPKKADVIAIQYAEVPDDETDVQAPFKAGALQGEAFIILDAK